MTTIKLALQDLITFPITDLILLREYLQLPHDANIRDITNAIYNGFARQPGKLRPIPPYKPEKFRSTSVLPNLSELESMPDAVVYEILRNLDATEIKTLCSANKTVWAQCKRAIKLDPHKTTVDEIVQRIMAMQTYEQADRYCNTSPTTRVLCTDQRVQETKLYIWLKKYIPDLDFNDLNSLEYLDLRNNDLQEIPPELGLLSSLKELYLSDNELQTVPPEFGSLSSLQRLYLRDNNLKKVPPELGLLSALKVLDLSFNNLQSVPPELGSLHSLQELYLNNNNLQEVPPELGSLYNVYI